jgi:hypothetical protein
MDDFITALEGRITELQSIISLIKSTPEGLTENDKNTFIGYAMWACIRANVTYWQTLQAKMNDVFSPEQRALFERGEIMLMELSKKAR